MYRMGYMLAGVVAIVTGSSVLAKDAEDGRRIAREQQVTLLREQGQAGLDVALAEYDGLVKQRTQLQEQLIRITANVAPTKSAQAPPTSDEAANIGEQLTQIENQLAEWRSAIDQIGGQRSCSVSRLYWYTDLAAAKAEAVRRGRPILSLRMLGKLTDEYSCANSRFFRTTLYSNKSVSDFLRTNFVLHWQSVRPVPRVTIDFGDGRKLERTLTGNSAHYVLASDGTPIDALPGLYSPLRFRQWAWDVCHFYGSFEKAAESERAGLLQDYHQRQLAESLRRWDFDIQQLSNEREELATVRVNHALASARLAGQEVPANLRPKAARAANLAVTKSMAEAPMLRFAKLGGTWMERAMDDELWQAIADLYREEVKLDEASVTLVRQEFPAARLAGQQAFHKMRVEDPILRVVAAFENSIALDTVRNEYLLHRRIHEAFANGQPETANFDALNEWVYAQLFLTPSSDPWLGLAPPDVYTALENDGRTAPAGEFASGGG